ncbi:MAG: hypothetical protein K9M08_08505 [Pirellula sp.]|nr:hypothetical protein [Pirellula sp.]
MRQRLDPFEYPANCVHHIAAINIELANIATLERLKAGPYADSADDIDELLAIKDRRIIELCEWVEVQLRETIRTSKKRILKQFEPHALYAREDIARHKGQIRTGYESLCVLFSRSTELYELCLQDGVLMESVLPALERNQALIDETNEQLASQIDRFEQTRCD